MCQNFPMGVVSVACMDRLQKLWHVCTNKYIFSAWLSWMGKGEGGDRDGPSFLSTSTPSLNSQSSSLANRVQSRKKKINLFLSHSLFDSRKYSICVIPRYGVILVSTKVLFWEGLPSACENTLLSETLFWSEPSDSLLDAIHWPTAGQLSKMYMLCDAYERITPYRWVLWPVSLRPEMGRNLNS